MIGWPVKHSRSPLIHGYWIKRYGLDAIYRREEVTPEQFTGFIRSLGETYAGANVTLPRRSDEPASPFCRTCAST